MKKLLLACTLFFSASASALACNDGVDINVFGISHHPNGGNVDQQNYGLGLRCNWSRDVAFGFKPFLEADMLTNSNRGKATIIGGGVKNDAVFRLGSFSFGGGLAVVNIGYENPRFHRTKYTWTPAGFLSTTYDNKWTVDLAPVPKQDKGIYLGWVSIKRVWQW